MDNIIRFLGEENYWISVFIDLTKAFNTFDRNILLHKLEQYDLRGHAYMCLRSYLRNKLQYTTINEASSTHRQVRCGVPQGSVPGRLLFDLYINDIHHAVGGESVRLFRKLGVDEWLVCLLYRVPMKMPEARCVFVANWVKSLSRLFPEPPTTCIITVLGAFTLEVLRGRTGLNLIQESRQTPCLMYLRLYQ